MLGYSSISEVSTKYVVAAERAMFRTMLIGYNRPFWMRNVEVPLLKLGFWEQSFHLPSLKVVEKQRLIYNFESNTCLRPKMYV